MLMAIDTAKQNSRELQEFFEAARIAKACVTGWPNSVKVPLIRT
ncbi:hypothetical protein ACFPL7_08515 [Dongia soli]|uniref:Uncharacterized protein n=1 Tax=Dongia soli TaxID=600628 RepID=A0ABU5E9S3_9PROT|nr:hypothetical protein [Dongia soli]MDY0882989.1 hypothetical protein [Dongia soli]